MEGDSRSATILVVEDDPDTRDLLVAFFSRQGYEVTAVTSAEAGLETLQHHATDIVVSDNQLEGTRTGAWMLRQAFEEGLLERVGVVMYTADSMRPPVPRRVRVLKKPTALREIETAAEHAADSARARG